MHPSMCSFYTGLGTTEKKKKKSLKLIAYAPFIIIKCFTIPYPFTQVHLGHEISMNAMPHILLKFSSKSGMEVLEVYGNWTVTQEKTCDEQG